MAINPKRVLAQVALRTLQLTGTTQATLETSYETADLSTVLDGADVNYQAMVDAVLAAEAELAEVVGADKQNPYRSLLYGRSDNLVSGTEIPIESDESVKFIGVFSQVNDATDNLPLTEQPIQSIRRFLRGSYESEIYNYSLQAGRIYHTRDNVYLEGCVWSRTAAVARMVAASTALSPLPTVLESTWVARAISFLPQEGWLLQEASYYAEFAAAGVAMLRGRSLDMPSLPDSRATSNPIVN